jgi:type I restriction enzyme R subunit
MLDTGIDVPEVVNLVFAKPVRSYVKFWQMIGRGTRLCRDLFGPGKDKTEFLIFDHWRNFQFFDQEYVRTEPAQPKSLLQHLFEARVALAAAALDRMDEATFQQTIALLEHDVKATRGVDSIEVRDRARELELLADPDRLAHFAVATQGDLLAIVAPLQRTRNIRGDEDAYRFDLLTTRLQLELVRGGPDAPAVADLRGRVEEAIELLAKNQNPVKAKAESIAQVRSKAYWAAATAPAVDALRRDLRSIMKYQQPVPTGRVSPLEYDVPDRDFAGESYTPRSRAWSWWPTPCASRPCCASAWPVTPPSCACAPASRSARPTSRSWPARCYSSTTRPTSSTCWATSPRPGGPWPRCSAG